jgi:hypothetical protein
MPAAVSVFSLLLPILLSAVFVFILSSVLHMALTYHQSDFRRIPDEAAVRDALGRLTIPPGDYMVPRGEGMASMKDPEFVARLVKGPVFLATFLRPGPPNMGPSLAKWFLYCVVVSLFAGYVAGITLPAGTPYMTVFRVAGTVAFVGYAMAYWQNAIWYGRSVSTTLKVTFDGLLYGLVTAGTFGWLWPKA